MKYFLIGLSVTVFLVFIFFNQKSEDQLNTIKRGNVDSENFKTEPVSLAKSKDRKTGDNRKVENNIVENSLVKKVMELSNEAIDEIAECERKFDDVLTVPVDDIAKVDNQSLLYVLEEFDEMKVTSAKLSNLLDVLSRPNSEIKSSDLELMENLSLIRPCRPFEKIALINELTKRIKDEKNDRFFKERLQKSILVYLKKELGAKSNLSTVNMIANVVHSLLEENIFDESLYDKSEIILENLETEFDDLVDLAEESLENGDDFNQGLLSKESSISEKYRSQLNELVNRM